jgi:hypothetical protein
MAKVKKMAFGGMGRIGKPGMMGRPGMGAKPPAPMTQADAAKMASAQAAYSAPPQQANLQALQGMLKGLPLAQGPAAQLGAAGGAPAMAGPPTMGGRLGAAGNTPPPMGMQRGRLASAIPNMSAMSGTPMKKGGKVRTASQRADGIAQRGKTRA